MTKNNQRGIEDLLNLFSDSLSPADVLTSKLMAQISSSITAERLRLNLSQSQFASLINASQSLVSRWESGDYNFSIRKLAEIACELGLDINISIDHLTTTTIHNHTEISDKIINFPASNRSPYINTEEELEEM